MSSMERLPGTGQPVVRLSAPAAPDGMETSIAVAPGLGCNLMSFRVGGQEFLLAEEQAGASYRILGTPVLYPTPNRVRDGQFSFNGRVFAFPPNNGRNAIHGLVRERAWAIDRPKGSQDSVSITGRFAFAPGDEAYAFFPIRNVLELTFAVFAGRVRLTFVVRNTDSEHRLPFGFGVHPYWRVLGARDRVRIQVPATSWMEAIDLLPTGRLVPHGQASIDLRQPTPLATLALDDVLYGMTEQTPMTVFYDDIGMRLQLTASDVFTHCVVFTPPDRPFFCLENQTCSTDAHNLHARGQKNASHLLILGPGETATGWVQYSVSRM